MSNLAILTRNIKSINNIVHKINGVDEGNKVKLIIEYPFRSNLGTRYSFKKKIDINIYRILRKAFFEGQKFDGKINVATEVIKSLSHDSIKQHIQKHNIDYIILKNAPILPEAIINNMGVNIYNFHSGYLPRYRGVSCGIWPVVEKDIGSIGVTLHEVTGKIDQGEILKRCKIPISVNGFYYPSMIAKAQEELIGEILRNYNFKKIQYEDIDDSEWINSKYYGQVGFTQYLKGLINLKK